MHKPQLQVNPVTEPFFVKEVYRTCLLTFRAFFLSNGHFFPCNFILSHTHLIFLFRTRVALSFTLAEHIGTLPFLAAQALTLCTFYCRVNGQNKNADKICDKKREVRNKYVERNSH